jgi:hypothetical protein
MTTSLESIPSLYANTLMEIEAAEERLLDSPMPVTRHELKELGKLHRNAANYREAIFRSWTRAEPLPKKSLFKNLFIKN